jgi:hypothetical protein
MQELAAHNTTVWVVLPIEVLAVPNTTGSVGLHTAELVAPHMMEWVARAMRAWAGRVMRVLEAEIIAQAFAESGENPKPHSSGRTLQSKLVNWSSF